MAIINGLNNNVGVQTLDSQLDVFRGYQSHDIVNHPNGNLYACWAQGSVNGADEMAIWAAMSADNGFTWTAPLQITTGPNWDTYPSIIVVNPSSSTSDLGIMFCRNANTVTTLTNELFRLTISYIDTSLSSIIDQVGSGVSFAAGFPQGVTQYNLNLAGTAWGYTARCPASLSIAPATNTTGYTLNAWSTLAGQAVTSTGNEMMYVRIKILANGDLAMVGTMRTGLNGAVASTYQGIIRQDVFVAFSSNGTTWSNVANLTGYSGTASFTEAGFTTAYHPDIVQLSDGSLTVVYQESLAMMLMAPGTTPAESGASYDNIVHYNATNGQFYYFQFSTQLSVLDLPNQTVNHLTSATTPNTWTDNLNTIARSSDDQYVAVGTTDGGISIYDTTADFPISGWTNYQFRTGSTQALLSNDVTSLYWLPGTHKLLIGTATINGLQLLDMTTPGSPTISTVAPSGMSSPYIAAPTLSGLLVYDANYLYSLDPTTLAFNYKIALSGSTPGGLLGREIFVDGINNEILYLGANSVPATLTIYNESGGAFHLLRSYTPTSTPCIPASAGMQAIGTSCVLLYGINGNDIDIHLYSFVARAPVGMVSAVSDFTYGDWILGTKQYPMKTFNFGGTNWYVMNRTVAGPIIAPCDNAGRLRVGNYPYNTGTHAVNTSGVNIYDACNSVKVGSNFNKLRIPHITAAVDNTIVILTKVFDPFNTTTDPVLMYIARLAPSTYGLRVKARILSHLTSLLQCKARVSSRYTNTFTCKAHISHSTQLSIRANIIPRTNKTFTCKAKILGRRSVTLDCSFLANPSTSTQLLVQFLAGSGASANQGLSALARIVPQQRARLTGTYNGVAIRTPSATSSFTSILGGQNFFTSKARIV